MTTPAQITGEILERKTQEHERIYAGIITPMLDVLEKSDSALAEFKKDLKDYDKTGPHSISKLEILEDMLRIYYNMRRTASTVYKWYEKISNYDASNYYRTYAYTISNEIIAVEKIFLDLKKKGAVSEIKR